MANDADLDFGSLAVGVSGHDPLTEEFQAIHLRLDSTSDVIACPLFPERSSKACVARRIWFRGEAAGQSSFQARPLRRIGMTASAPRSMMAVWHRRVS